MNNQHEVEEQNNEQSRNERVDLDFVEADILEKLKSEQNLPRGVLFAGGAALVGAAIWALITVLTEYQIGFMAVGVGLLVGFAMRKGGQGIEPIYGIIGATLALFGCMLGNILTYYWFGFDMGSLGLSEMIALNFQGTMDYFFFGLAIYEGYKFSFRKVTEAEVAQYAT